VQAYAAEGRVGDGGAAEGEVEVCESGEAEGEDFGCGVGEGAAEGLCWGGLLAGTFIVFCWEEWEVDMKMKMGNSALEDFFSLFSHVYAALDFSTHGVSAAYLSRHVSVSLYLPGCIDASGGSPSLVPSLCIFHLSCHVFRSLYLPCTYGASMAYFKEAKC